MGNELTRRKFLHAAALREVIGEAAGVVTAIAAKSNRLPHEVEWSEGGEQLTKMDLRILKTGKTWNPSMKIRPFQC